MTDQFAAAASPERRSDSAEYLTDEEVEAVRAYVELQAERLKITARDSRRQEYGPGIMLPTYFEGRKGFYESPDGLLQFEFRDGDRRLGLMGLGISRTRQHWVKIREEEGPGVSASTELLVNLDTGEFEWGYGALRVGRVETDPKLGHAAILEYVAHSLPVDLDTYKSMHPAMLAAVRAAIQKPEVVD